MLLRLCNCGKKIPYELDRCEKCQARHDQYKQESDRTYNNKRDDKYTKFYKTKEWRAVRETVKQSSSNLCCRCLANKKITAAKVCDHIVPLRIDWNLRLTISNLQMLCLSCHNQKTNEDKRKYG